MRETIQLKATTTATTDKGYFEAVISTASVDREKDVVSPAGMVRALKAWADVGKKVPLAWQHSTSAEDQIGWIDPATVRAVGEEVWAKGWIDQSTEVGQHAWRLVKAGTLGFSFGYLIHKSTNRKGGGRNLDEFDVFEMTATQVPMNNDTRVLSWKSLPEVEDQREHARAIERAEEEKAIPEVTEEWDLAPEEELPSVGEPEEPPDPEAQRRRAVAIERAEEERVLPKVAAVPDPVDEEPIEAVPPPVVEEPPPDPVAQRRRAAAIARAEEEKVLPEIPELPEVEDEPVAPPSVAEKPTPPDPALQRRRAAALEREEQEKTLPEVPPAVIEEEPPPPPKVDPVIPNTALQRERANAISREEEEKTLPEVKQATEDQSGDVSSILSDMIDSAQQFVDSETDEEDVAAMREVLDILQELNEPEENPEEPEAAKAVWSTQYINGLPDSSFLYIEPGGSKDETGRTTPRTLRHFPVKDGGGAVDMPHLRNALSRIPQSSLPANVKDSCMARARAMMNRQGGGPGKSTRRVATAPSGYGLLRITEEEMAALVGGMKSVWSATYVNDLPDGAFLFIEDGGTRDADGLTSPRTLRHFPYKTASGDLDMPHLHGALAQIPKVAFLSEPERNQLSTKAQKILDHHRAGEDPLAKAVWSASYINGLPDGSFLYIEDGGSKDNEGKTTPRSLRHFPYKDSNGTVDLPHLRNALARIPQSNVPDSVKERLTATAQRILSNQKADGTGRSDKARPVDPLRRQADALALEYLSDGESLRKSPAKETPPPPDLMPLGELKQRMRHEMLTALSGMEDEA